MLINNNIIVGVTAALLSLSGTLASFLDKPSIATYWGQNSKGGVDTQKPLSFYCDDSSDLLIMSFVLNFKDGGLPVLNLANGCNGPNFPGTGLLQCPDVGTDIKICQNKGKTVLMSLGGAAGIYGFANDGDGEAFADTLWNLFGAGSSSTRPFGDAVLDGFDLDIEGGGPTGYAAMVRRLRTHFSTDKSKQYFITGAPQCPFPDAMMGTIMDQVGFDAVNVQFYNNYCSTTSGSFNFNTWDTWAKTTSPNKNVKILLGLPGSSAAAGSGYVPFGQLQPIVKDLSNTYSSFGGVMLWDASASYANTDISPSYQVAVANLVHGLANGGSTPSTTSTISTTTTASTTTKTTSTTTKTTTTTTTSTTAAPTSTPVTCIKDGQKCSTEGQVACSGNSFAMCNHGAWGLQGCPSGLTCFSTTDGSSVYCGQGSGSSTTCDLISTLEITRNTLNTGVVKKTIGPSAKPYMGGHVIAQFSVTKSDAKSFTALVNVRRFDKISFGKTITAQFKVADNITVTSVEGGTVIQKGNQVKVQLKNEKKTMMAVIQLKGQIKGGIFVAPKVNTMKFY
ncbi:hypothetical protein INT47_007251 [Mucor saturninus]|uniref:chitinase n=1 Tax=Mucor saturninus TaxID=64648 RepID=A0A8H7R8R9_9FUNG|nr:hypothetical protein INT47_007251 [Mucor saturninus]